MLVGSTGADETDGSVAQLDLVERARLGVLGELCHALVGHQALGTGVGRHHDPVLDARLKGDGLASLALPYLDGRARVGDAHRGAHHADSGELLGEPEGLLGHLKSLGGVGGLEHGNAGKCSVVAAVLLVLRREHARVVGCEQHQAAAHARIGKRHERVGGDVDADVLHRHERAVPCHGEAQGVLKGDLLVDGPLRIDVVELGERLERLGRRGARIAETGVTAGFPRSPGYGLIAAEQLFHRVLSIPGSLELISASLRR